MTVSSIILNQLPSPPVDKQGWPWVNMDKSLTDIQEDGNPQLKVTIITPSYNQATYLEETIRSILLQNYPNVEYIVMDGGSTDHSVDIIRKYEKQLNYWVSERDKGQVDAINKGFRRATGDIVCWLNSDDIYMSPQVISQVAAFFDEYPSIDAVTGAGVILSEDGSWVRQTQVVPNRISFQHLRYRNTVLQPATFFRREVLAKLPIDETLHFAFDWDFWIRLTRYYNVLAVDNVWAGYRMWGDNKTARGVSDRTREQAEVTGRYLGKWSWQYLLLLLFYWLYRTAEKMPNRVHAIMKTAVRITSRFIGVISYGRIPRV